MKSTLYDYINFVLFLTLSTLSVFQFIFTSSVLDNQIFNAFFAVLFSFLAIFTSYSAGDIWLNSLYQKATRPENVHFYGRIIELESYSIQVKQCIRGIVLLTLIFVVPSIISDQLVFVSFSIAGIAVFLMFMFITINHFKKYLNNHITTTQNSP